MLIRTYADIEGLKGNAALSPAEKKLIENCKRGELTTLGNGTRPKRPSKARTIRADLLRYLILGGCEQCRVHEKGIELVGAWIEGQLDLSFAAAKGAVHLLRCAFGERILAYQASFDRLVLNGSSLPRLTAQGAMIKGDAFLDDLKSTGAVSFSGAEIGGQLSANRAELNGGGGLALNAQGAKIKGGAFLSNLKSTGEVSFGSAEIGVQLLAREAELSGDNGMALNAEGATIMGDVILRKLKSTGEVSLSGVVIAGQLSCNGADFNGGESKALNAQSATIKGGAFLEDLTSTGVVSFSAAEIYGQLAMVGAELNGGGSKVLNVQGATIKGDALLDNLISTGEVSLSGAEIGGQLAVRGAKLNGGDGKALNAQRATIKGSVFLRNLKSTGEVSFGGAYIDGQLSFHGVELNGGEGFALNAQRLVVRDGLYWKQVKTVVGTIDLNTAHLGDLVDDEQSWKAAPYMMLVGLTYEDLAGPLGLPFRKRWLRDGARFNGQFHPQPYQQLAKYYRETGHRHEAREILLEKEKEQRKAVRASIRKGTGKAESDVQFSVKAALSWSWHVARRWFSFHVWRWVRISWNCLWDILIRYIAGYGYKPWLSLWWLAGLVLLMTFAAKFTWNAGDFAPNSAIVLTSPEWKELADLPQVYTPLSDDSKRMIVEDMTPAQSWSGPHAPGKDYETFYSFAYALDVVVPVLDLGQTDAWAPSPARGDWGYWMFYLQKIFIVAGWVVTAIAAAAISGMIRRDD